MSKGWKYVSGQWNLICDVCGKKIKSSDAKHRWDGLIVCPVDFENRHPQDFIRARADKISVPFTRPLTINVFIDITGETFLQAINDESFNTVTWN